MDRELQRMSDTDWKVYNSKDIIQDLSITKDQFRNKTKRIEMVYGLDISKYRKSKDDSASNLMFNENEFEILKILYSNIDKFPLKITEQKFYDEEIRLRARDENPVAFVSYITEIVRVVDEIQSDDLKVHIYASKIYDETMEWLSARQKLDKSLSDFIRYTNSLEYTESAKRYRELAYRVDEMLFELMVDSGDDISDIDEITKDVIVQKDPFNIENFYRRQKNEKMTTPYASDTQRYSHESDDILLDHYIVNLLNEMHQQREEKRMEIKKKYNTKHKPRDVDIAEFLTEQNEKLQEWEIKDPKSLQLVQSHDDNLNRVKHAVQQYKQNHYKLKDYKDKLKDVINDQQKLENHEYFKVTFQNFYINLSSMSLLADMNKEKFIKDEISGEMINHFLNDISRIYKLIEKYDISGRLSKQGDRSEAFKQLYDEFNKIKNDESPSDIISNKTADITSWGLAEKLLENLDDDNDNL